MSDVEFTQGEADRDSQQASFSPHFLFIVKVVETDVGGILGDRRCDLN